MIANLLIGLGGLGIISPQAYGKAIASVAATFKTSRQTILRVRDKAALLPRNHS